MYRIKIVVIWLTVMFVTFATIGWTGSVLWNWFIPNIFTSAPTLRVGEAIGLTLVISTFVEMPDTDDDDDPLFNLIYGAGLKIVLQAVLLVAGYFIQAALY